MSRSIKKHLVSYNCCGATPNVGKKITSRKLRRSARQELHTQQEKYEVKKRQDKNRGHKGSQERDHGWDNFGDGWQYLTKSDVQFWIDGGTPLHQIYMK